MKQQMLSLTIGIPAFNEEANIKRLLLTLLNQKQNNFILREIIVVSDGSSDGTIDAVKSIKTRIIKLVRNPARCGQIYCQNLIFTKAESDIVVILEADTIPATNQYLMTLLSPLIQDTRIGCVQGNTSSSPSRNLLGRVLGLQQDIYSQLSMHYGKEMNWLCSGRGGRAFVKKVYKSLRWPPNVPEDVYAYLWCQKNNVKLAFAKDAVCLYQAPEYLGDLVKQRQKIISSIHSLRQYFPNEMIDQFYLRPLLVKLLMSLQFLIQYPHYFFIYLLLTLWIKVNLNKSDFTDHWEIANSTKQLIYP